MKVAMGCMVVCLLSVSGYLVFKERDAIKSLAGVGDSMSEKSIVEDVCYWVWPEKWEKFQQDRMEAQYERACNADSK